MAVPITVKGDSVEPGAATALFQPRIADTPTSFYRQQYDVDKDGRFLINLNVEDAVSAPITLLQNWKPPTK